MSPSDELALDHEAFLNHKMNFLDEDKSWELLLKKLFLGSSDKKNSQALGEKGEAGVKKMQRPSISNKRGREALGRNDMGNG